jgi:type IV pilus assembly protein PilA
MSTLNSRLQLSLLNRKKAHNLLEKGFTLVELMIVIVIVGVLSSVALPNFLGTKSKAEAGALAGSLAGLAKECSTNAIIDSASDVTASTSSDITFVPDTANMVCKDGAEFSNKVVLSNIGELDGSKCLDAVHDGETTTGGYCVIDITTDGVTTGAWSTSAAS